MAYVNEAEKKTKENTKYSLLNLVAVAPFMLSGSSKVARREELLAVYNRTKAGMSGTPKAR